MNFRPLLIFLLVFLVACTARPAVVLSPVGADVGKIETIYVSTTRKLDDQGRPTRGRSERSSYFRYDISVPPVREEGSIQTATRNVDPETDFVATRAEVISNNASFKSEISGALRRKPAADRDVLIYVHGFNNTFDESILRLAQLSHDFEANSVAIAYSWPSAAHALEYEFDRDSNLFSRDGLEDLINTAKSAGARKIILAGHSMGTQLIMETLRQMEIRSPSSAARIISSVILISPDIDVDVFKSQARRIGELPKNFYIFVSHEDRLLGLSSFVSGKNDRVGNIKDVNELIEFNVNIIDVSDFSTGLGHNLPSDSPELINMLNHLGSADNLFQSTSTSLASAVVLTVSGATQLVLSPVTGVAP